MVSSDGDPVRLPVGSGNLVVCSRVGGGWVRRGTAGRAFYLGWGGIALDFGDGMLTILVVNCSKNKHFKH